MVRFASSLPLLIAGLLLAFQNCGHYSPMSSISLASAGTGYCLAHSTDPYCSQAQAARCSFNGNILAESDTVTAYLTSSVSTGSVCQSQTRSCAEGILSGSFSYATCAVSGPAACLFNGATIASGASVTAYLNSVEANGSTCTPLTRTCLDGVLSGTASYSSCTVSGPKSCLFNGQTIPHGQSVTAFDVSTASNAAQCQPSQRTCYDGALTGHGNYASCGVTFPASCLFNGLTIAGESGIVAYPTSSVPYGQSCQGNQRICIQGSLTGSGDFGSCSVNKPASCLINGLTIPDGSSGTFYFSASDTTCSAEARVCSNGVLSGSATYSSCQFPTGTVPTIINFSTLAAANQGCLPTDLHSAACASAFSRACTASGFATGFGPLEIGDTWAQAACVGPAVVAARTVPWSDLQYFQPTCTSANTTSDACVSAAHKYCLANGYPSGLNIVEISQPSATVNCLTGSGHDELQCNLGRTSYRSSRMLGFGQSPNLFDRRFALLPVVRKWIQCGLRNSGISINLNRPCLFVSARFGCSSASGRLARLFYSGSFDNKTGRHDSIASCRCFDSIELHA